MTADSRDQEEFDAALIRAAMDRAAQVGWQRLSLVDAAREAGLPLEEVRARFPFKTILLTRLGRLADESALRDDGSASSLREHLFDLLMRRFDLFQQYREGVRAILHAMPYDPALSLFLGAGTVDTMRWIAQAAGIDTQGLSGFARIQGLVGIWAHTVRAWEKDESADLSTTMAALDQALDRAERLNILRPLPGTLPKVPRTSDGLPDLPLES